MKHGFIYTRWLFTLTFCCLMGLLVVGMMAVHSKRTLRALAVSMNRKESELAELGRRQDILDTDLASSLNPAYLKQLVSMFGLQLGPPREDRIIVVRSMNRQPVQSAEIEVVNRAPRYRTRFEFANNQPRESN